MLEARENRKIRHIGITSHRLNVAAGLSHQVFAETLQFHFPIWHLKRLELVEACRKADMGFIAMRKRCQEDSSQIPPQLCLSGKRFDHVLPI